MHTPFWAKTWQLLSSIYSLAKSKLYGTSVRALLNSHWKVKLLVLTIPLSAILTFMLGFRPEKTADIFPLGVVALFVLFPLGAWIASHTTKPPSGLDKSGSFRTTWLQLESVFQFYLQVQLIFSFFASLLAFVQLGWAPLIVLAMSSIFFPVLVFFALLAFRIGLEPAEASPNKVKAAYVSSLAEALIDDGKTGDAISYLKYGLQILNDERQSRGYEFGLAQEVISLLGVIETEGEDFPEAALKGLAAFLAQGPSYRSCGAGLRSFLRKLSWKKDITFLKKEGGTLQSVTKIASHPITGVIGALLYLLIFIFQDQIREAISGFYVQVTSQISINVDVLINRLVPSILWIPGVVWVSHIYVDALKYRVAWTDIATTV